MLAIRAVDVGSGADITQIVVTLIVTSGVIVAAVFGYLGNRSNKAARVAAEQTQETNSADHGRVAGVLGELRREMREGFAAVADRFDHMDGRVDDIVDRQGTQTDQFVIHQQWHLDHPPTPREQNP